MKLRINGDSVRFRVRRSEVAKLIDFGRVEETVYFTSTDEVRLVYALREDPTLTCPTLLYRSGEVVIALPTRTATEWAKSDQVGIYAAVDLGPRGTLNLIVEKDFACLDLGDADNADTFPNPNTNAVC
jgi:hypothetical protein